LTDVKKMQRENQSTAAIRPSLSTRCEIDWLLGNKQVSDSYKRKMRCVINRKLQTLTRFEIPLLLDKGFDVTAVSSGVTAGSNTTNALVANAWESEGRVNYEVEQEESPRRDSDPRPKVYSSSGGIHPPLFLHIHIKSSSLRSSSYG
jgi:hypothetical protein